MGLHDAAIEAGARAMWETIYLDPRFKSALPWDALDEDTKNTQRVRTRACLAAALREVMVSEGMVSGYDWEAFSGAVDDPKPGVSAAITHLADDLSEP